MQTATRLMNDQAEEFSLSQLIAIARKAGVSVKIQSTTGFRPAPSANMIIIGQIPSAH